MKQAVLWVQLALGSGRGWLFFEILHDIPPPVADNAIAFSTIATNVIDRLVGFLRSSVDVLAIMFVDVAHTSYL